MDFRPQNDGWAEKQREDGRPVTVSATRQEPRFHHLPVLSGFKRRQREEESAAKPTAHGQVPPRGEQVQDVAVQFCPRAATVSVEGFLLFPILQITFQNHFKVEESHSAALMSSIIGAWRKLFLSQQKLLH